MRRTLFDLFGKSPFGPLQDHLKTVMSCVRLVPDFLRALESGDEAALQDIGQRIQQAEHDADEIKNRIRGEVPRSLLIPVERADLLDILALQDRIADWAEDVVVLAGLRRLPFPVGARDELWEFAGQVMSAVEEYGRLGEELSQLVEASFGGAQAHRAMERIVRLGREEHLADVKQRSLLRRLLELEGEMGPLNVVLWMKVLEKVGDLANGAERAGNHIRLFLSE